MTYLNPNLPKIYNVDIGPVTVATHNTSKELALTAALYWLGEHAMKYGMDPNQYVMEDLLQVNPAEEATGAVCLTGASDFPSMREFRTIAPPFALPKIVPRRRLGLFP